MAAHLTRTTPSLQPYGPSSRGKTTTAVSRMGIPYASISNRWGDIIADKFGHAFRLILPRPGLPLLRRLLRVAGDGGPCASELFEWHRGWIWVVFMGGHKRNGDGLVPFSFSM